MARTSDGHGGDAALPALMIAAVDTHHRITALSTQVRSILGYDPQSLVSIEYIRSLGDWKTAWDHIHFRGFLGTPMTLQLTWQGCDSLLAAPLVLDLVRLTEFAQLRGQGGVTLQAADQQQRLIGAVGVAPATDPGRVLVAPRRCQGRNATHAAGAG